MRVELFGIPRLRAGVCEATLAAATLGEALTALAAQFPRLNGECICNGQLAAGYAANLNGERFVNDPATALSDRDTLLLLAADAGG